MDHPEPDQADTAKATQNPQRAIRKGVLLIHGFSGSPHEFAPILPLLHERGYAARTVTLPAHGDEPDLPIHATTAEAMLEHCYHEALEFSREVDELYIAGHSLGAAYSLLTAARKPDKLVGVVAYSAPFQHAYFYNYPQGLIRLSLKRMIGCLRYAPADQLKCIRPKFEAWTVPRLLRQSRLIFQWMQERTHQVTVPVRLLHSVYDLVVPYGEMEKIANTLSGPVTMTTLRRSGHRIFPGSRDKDVALETLLEFMAEDAHLMEQMPR